MSRVFRLAAAPPRAYLVAIVGMLTGCAAAPVAHEQEAHELPRHHPQTFRRAIDELEERGAAGSSRSDAAALRELTDIVGWLPMLAADTELSRAEWERVRGISLVLASVLDAGDGRRGITPEYREAVADLRAIAGRLPAEPTATSEED